MLNFCGKGRKVIFKDEINDPLIRTKAVFQRYFFGENLNLPYGFGRQVPKFPKSRNALSIEQYDGHAAAAATSGIGLWCHCGDQVGQ